MITSGKLTDDALITPARDAIDRVFVLRLEAASEALGKNLLAAFPGIKLVAQDKPLFEGSTQTPDILDPDATFKANPGIDKNLYRTTLQAWKSDPGHQGNVLAAKQVVADISAVCAGR
jgi:hypothetical protein